MTSRLELRVIVGILIWIGLLGGAVLILRTTWTRSPKSVGQLMTFTANQRYSVRVNFDDLQIVRFGDPVFLASSSDYPPIGHVSCAGPEGSITKQPTWADSATITFYGNAPRVNERDFLNYHSAGHDSAWVMKTMLTPAKRHELAQLIQQAYSKNQAEIVDAIRPVLAESLQAAGVIIKADLKTAFARREDRMREIGKKYQRELVETELVPLLQQEIWPLLLVETEPLAGRIGQEIWQEVSLFRFGWRYLYDRSPLPDQNLSRQEFNRFVEQKVLPILQSHLNDFLDLQKKLVQKLSQNSKVRDTVSSAVKTVMTDPAIQEIFVEVFREVFIDNVRLKESLESHWNSPAAQQALELTSQRLEPTITEIGIALFGSPREKITPEFARVMRHRILHKDDRWFTLQTTDASGQDTRAWRKPTTIAVRIADPVGEIPFAPARVRN